MGRQLWVIIFLTAGSGTLPLQCNKTLSSTQSYGSSSKTPERSTLPCKWWGARPAEEDQNHCLHSSSLITSYFYSTLYFLGRVPREGARNCVHNPCISLVSMWVWACKRVTFLLSVTAHACLLTGFNEVQIRVNQWKCKAYMDASSHEMINMCNTTRPTRVIS